MHPQSPPSVAINIHFHRNTEIDIPGKAWNIAFHQSPVAYRRAGRPEVCLTQSYIAHFSCIFDSYEVFNNIRVVDLEEIFSGILEITVVGEARWQSTVVMKRGGLGLGETQDYVSRKTSLISVQYTHALLCRCFPQHSTWSKTPIWKRKPPRRQSVTHSCKHPHGIDFSTPPLVERDSRHLHLFRVN